MTTRHFLRKIINIDNINDLQPDYEDGTLVLSHNQAVIDECINKSIPVVGVETENNRLNCSQIIFNPEDVEAKDFEKMYRRCVGIPLDIAYTKRCFIREYGEEDLDDLFSLYSMPSMTDYMEPLFEYDSEREYEKNYIEYIYKLYGFGMWLIFDRFTGKLIGRAGIEIRETCDRDGQAELGFAIASNRWREGLGYEVCSKIIEIAKTEFELNSLIARCDPKNNASIRLLKKLGFSGDGYEEDGDLRFFREI